MRVAVNIGVHTTHHAPRTTVEAPWNLHRNPLYTNPGSAIGTSAPTPNPDAIPVAIRKPTGALDWPHIAQTAFVTQRLEHHNGSCGPIRD